MPRRIPGREDPEPGSSWWEERRCEGSPTGQPGASDGRGLTQGVHFGNTRPAKLLPGLVFGIVVVLLLATSSFNIEVFDSYPGFSTSGPASC